MAELSEAFHLCTISEKHSLVGLEKHSEDDKVLLTLKDRGILVYKVSDQKLVKSWSVEQKQDLTCAAVYDPHSATYITVINSYEIYQWKEDVKDLLSALKTKVKKAVVKVLITDIPNIEPVLIFEDGDICQLSQAREQQSTKKTQHSFIWSEIYHNIVLMIKLQGVGYKLNVHHLIEKTTNTYDLVPLTEGSKLCCSTFIPSVKQLICFWSDGSLAKICLSEVLQEQPQQEAQLQSKLIHRLSNMCTLKSKEEVPISMVTAAPSHIILSGCQKIDKTLHDIVAVWDIKFGVLQSLRKLSISTPADRVSSPSGYGVQHICCHSNNVVVATSQAVIGCSFEIQPSSLSSALGRLTMTSKFSKSGTVTPDLLVTGKLIQPKQVLDDWSETLRTQHLTEQQILDKLLNSTKITTPKLFNKELENYIKSKLESGEEATDTTNNRTSCDVSQHFVTSVLSRCLTDDKVWSSKGVSMLLKTHCVPASSSKELVSAVLEKNDMKLLEKCFLHIKGIPESCIVASLKHVLRLKDDSSEEEMEVDHSDKDLTLCKCPVSKEKENYLDLILAYPMNDVFMQNSLKNLSFGDVVVLLKYLLYLIKHCSSLGSDLLKENHLTYPQALDWAGLIINCHFTQLVLVPEVQELILDVQHAVEKQIAVYNKLQGIEGYLEHFKTHQTLPKSQHVGVYCVETLEL